MDRRANNRGILDFWPFDRRGTHAILALSAVVGMLVFVISLKAVFTPFFIALIMAYIFNPLVNYGEKLRLPRWLCVFFIFVLFSVLLSFMIFVLVPSVINETRELLTTYNITKPSSEKVIRKVEEYGNDYIPPVVLKRMKSQIREGLNNLHLYVHQITTNALEILGSGVLPWFKLFINMCIGLVFIAFYFFFLSNSLNRMWDFVVNSMVPFEYKNEFGRISQKMHQALSAFFRGRLIICMIISTITCIGLSLLKVPFPLIFGFGIGFATLVPMLGLLFLFPLLGIYALVGADIGDISLLLGFYMMIQGLEMLVLTPVLLGREVELHPMVLVLAILVCGYLFGVIGVLFAVPIASTAKILFYEFILPSFLELSVQEKQQTSGESS